jgi:threonine/homoserine/homoserine lactone efflux protein
MPTDSSFFAIFVFSFLAALGAVASPGPVSTAIVSQAPRRGWTVGPLVASGHALMELCIVLLITLGLGTLLAHQGVQTAIALAGALLLAWMGASLLWAVWRGRIHLPRQDQQEGALSIRQLIGLGIAATLTNPFWYAWWVTVAAAYLVQARALSLAAVLAFYLGHISADYLWDTLLSTVIGGGRRWMTDGLYRGLIVLCGGFFLYLGWMFLRQGLSAF